jgi:hypothetical protein
VVACNAQQSGLYTCGGPLSLGASESPGVLPEALSGCTGPVYTYSFSVYGGYTMFGKLGMTLALAGATLFFTTSLAVAAEGTVTKMDEKGAMVRMGDREHMVGMIPGAKVGDKVNCTEAGGRSGAGGSIGTTGGSTGGMAGGSTGGSTGGTTGGTAGGTTGGTAGGSTGTTGGTTGGTAGGSTGTTGGMTGGTAGTTTAMQMTCTKM